MNSDSTATTLGDGGNLTLSAIEQMREKLKLVIYYNLSETQERGVVMYLQQQNFVILHPDDLQMMIDGLPSCQWVKL